MPIEVRQIKMIIDCFATDKFAISELARRTDDEIVSLSDLMNEDEYEVFSERPFVLALDYGFSFEAEIISRFLSTKFGGTKVLYCMFIGATSDEKGLELAKKIASTKKLVLFGVCKVDHFVLSKDEYFAKLDQIGFSVNNVVPLESFCGESFPCATCKRKKLASNGV